MFFQHQVLTDHATLTGGLQAAIENAYRVFSIYTLPLPLRVCYCDVCVSQETARLLVETPLRQISVEVLSEYTSSAHGYDEEMHGTSLRYFLPRYFDLIALNQAPYHDDLAQCLKRLAAAGYRQNWRREEVAAIDQYFDALIADKSRDVSVIAWPVGHRLGYPMQELIEMMVLAGADVPRVLASFDAAPDPGAALHIAALARELRWNDGAMELASIMIDNSDPARYAIGAALAAPHQIERLERVFFTLADQPILQEIASDGLQLLEVMVSISSQKR